MKIKFQSSFLLVQTVLEDAKKLHELGEVTTSVERSLLMAEDQYCKDPQSPETAEGQASNPTQEPEKMVSVMKCNAVWNPWKTNTPRKQKKLIAKALENTSKKANLQSRIMTQGKPKQENALLDKIALLNKPSEDDEVIKTSF